MGGAVPEERSSVRVSLSVPHHWSPTLEITGNPNASCGRSPVPGIGGTIRQGGARSVMTAAGSSGFRTTGGLSGSLRTMSFENTCHPLWAAYAVYAQPVFLAMPISRTERNLKTAPNQSGKSLARQVGLDMVYGRQNQSISIDPETVAKLKNHPK